MGARNRVGTGLSYWPARLKNTGSVLCSLNWILGTKIQVTAAECRGLDNSPWTVTCLRQFSPIDLTAYRQACKQPSMTAWIPGHDALFLPGCPSVFLLAFNAFVCMHCTCSTSDLFYDSTQLVLRKKKFLC